MIWHHDNIMYKYYNAHLCDLARPAQSPLEKAVAGLKSTRTMLTTNFYKASVNNNNNKKNISSVVDPAEGLRFFCGKHFTSIARAVA